MVRYLRLYKAAFGALVLAIVVRGFAELLSPPAYSAYSQRAASGNIIIDKDFIEGTLRQYPPIASWLIWAVGHSSIIPWLFPITEEAIVAGARKRSGLGPKAPFWCDIEGGERLLGPPEILDSYNSTYWLRHLRTYIKAVKEEASPQLSFLGWIIIRETLIDNLAHQMMIVDLIKKNPEILEEKIDRPIVIAGPPRTMTTHAQGILMNHPETNYYRFLEARAPFTPEGLDPKLIYTEEDPRATDFRYAMIFLRIFRPFATYMFRLEPTEAWNTPNEDIFLTQLVFGSSALETQTYVPSYSKMWHTEDNTLAYRFQKIMHQFLQWQDRKRTGIVLPRRWLLKTPEYAGFIKQAMKVYPDAIIMLTHRDPVQVLESFIPLVIYFAGLWNSFIDAEKFAEYETKGVETRLRHLVEQIDAVPKNQIIHVPFRDFVKDNLGSIKEICQFAGLSLDDAAVAKMKEYIDKSPREGANRFEYRLSTFGSNFTRAKLQERFKFYTDKFRDYV